jgi:hypothetical protein
VGGDYRGGRSRGWQRFSLSPLSRPETCYRKNRPAGGQLISTLPPELWEILDETFGNVLWVAAERHSEYTYTLWMLDLDYRYNEWLACKSLDDRWTLSPRGGPCYDSVTTPLHNDTGVTWRGIASKHRRRPTTT